MYFIFCDLSDPTCLSTLESALVVLLSSVQTLGLQTAIDDTKSIPLAPAAMKGVGTLLANVMEADILRNS